jgi:hypothetical protein
VEARIRRRAEEAQGRVKEGEERVQAAREQADAVVVRLAEARKGMEKEVRE